MSEWPSHSMMFEAAHILEKARRAALWWGVVVVVGLVGWVLL